MCRVGWALHIIRDVLSLDLLCLWFMDSETGVPADDDFYVAGRSGRIQEGRTASRTERIRGQR